MIKTYTYKLYKNKRVERKFYHWLNICRYVYNCAKETKETAYTGGVQLSYFDLKKQLTEAKKEVTFLRNVHSQTLQTVIERLDNSFNKFFKGGGYPKWAKKGKYKSFRFTQGIRQTERGFYLPKFGEVKVFNNRLIKGKIKCADLIEKADGLYLSVIVEQDKEVKSANKNQVGIDMGISYFMSTSDGKFVENPKHLFKYLKQLRIENRKLSRKKKGSENFKKQVKVLQRLYLKVSETRKDFLHKESTKLATQYGVVFREDLNIKSMIKNKRLSKHILDCAWGTFFIFLQYKTDVYKVAPQYSSQTCNSCGHTAKENRKTQSLFECVNCGFSTNADENAAKNIKSWGINSYPLT